MIHTSLNFKNNNNLKAENDKNTHIYTYEGIQKEKKVSILISEIRAVIRM